MKRMRLLLFAAIVAAGGCGDGEGGKIPFAQAMAELSGRSPGALVRQMFESPDPDLRRSAIEELSRKDRGRRGPYLKAYAAMAADPAPTVRSAAVRALGRAGDSRYARTVADALKDGEETVRWDAAVALDSLADDQTVRPLAESATTDTSVDVRAAAAKALRHYPRKDVLDTLLRCLEDEAFCVRFQAAGALSELTGEAGGTDADRWREILAAKPDPFARPARPKRPWWDWFGLTGPKKGAPGG